MKTEKSEDVSKRKENKLGRQTKGLRIVHFYLMQPDRASGQTQYGDILGFGCTKLAPGVETRTLIVPRRLFIPALQ